MTPVGHASVTYILGNKLKKPLIGAFIIGGLLPDIDFILLPFSFFNALHRVVTHNVFFLVIVAALFFFFSKTDQWKIAMFLLLGGCVHLFIDAVLDSNPSNGLGVAVFWPVSEWFFSPFNLFKNRTVAYTWEQPWLFLKAILPQLIIEVPFIVGAVYLFFKKRLHFQKGRN